MSTGDHLTIRDYFDLVYTGKKRARKVFRPSAGTKVASGIGMFYRMLASRQMPGVRNTNVKSKGLTITDYLANPLHAHSRYQRLLNSSSSESRSDKSPVQPALAVTKVESDKITQSSQPAIEHLQSLRSSVSKASQKQSDSHKRQKIDKSIQKAASKYNLPAGLIKGVIRAESNFQVEAVSRAGAQGLMQLMPATAKELGVTKPFDIDQNIDGGSRYLRKMLDSFGGDVKLALAAYNAGPGTVRKYAGNVPYPETIQYIDRVLRFSNQTA